MVIDSIFAGVTFCGSILLMFATFRIRQKSMVCRWVCRWTAAAFGGLLLMLLGLIALVVRTAVT